MNSQLNLYDYVLACLRAKVIPQRKVAGESGVPFSTVAKIAQGSVTDPSVHTVQKLYDYFRSRPEVPPDLGAGGAAQPTSKPRPLSASGEGATPGCQTAGPDSTVAVAEIGGAGQGGARGTGAGDVREVV